jgi:hypothetical protein
VATADSPHRGLSGDDRGQAGHLQAVEQVAQRLGVAVECPAAVTGESDRVMDTLPLLVFLLAQMALCSVYAKRRRFR